MPLSPQEQAELDQLEQEVGHAAPRAQMTGKEIMDRAHTAFAPGGIADADQMLQAAGGSQTANALGQAINKGGFFSKVGRGAAAGGSQQALAPGQTMDERIEHGARGAAVGGGIGAISGGIDKLASWLRKPIDAAAGRAAGFSPAQTDAYSNNPAQVERFSTDLANGNKRAISDTIRDEANTANEVMGKQAGGMGDKLRELIKGKSVGSQADLQGISPEADKLLRLHDPVTGGLDAETAQRAKQVLQREANYAPNQMVTEQMQAKSQAAGKAAKKLQGAIEGLDPEVAQINQSTRPVIDAQKALVKGIKSPRTFVTGDKNAEAIQAIDEMTGSRLGGIGKEYSAAKAIQDMNHKGFVDRAVAGPVARRVLRTTQAIGSSQVPDALRSGAHQMTNTVQSKSPGLTPEEQAELDSLEKDVGHLVR